MEPIAIIGIGCRFPNANNPESFWKLLHNGIDAIAEVPKDRWDVDAYYDPDPTKKGKMSTRWGGFLAGVDQFDPSFFRISPREAEHMDPQQRLVLEVAWEALEDAAIAPERLGGSQTGVFLGIGNYDYGRFLSRDLSNINSHHGPGVTLSIAANRLSYLLDLHGPSMAIETACSSSLVAVHSACQSLRSRESNLVIAGGVSLMLSPDMTITFSQARMMASDGRCKTFDAHADGYVRGEGCGLVILKRLSDAILERDRILAVIKGSAVNHDGLSNGITAPNGLAQEAVIRQALQNAGVAPAEISYIEAHGTGTPLGDPIEIRALKAVLMQGRSPEQPCGIGSVKTNIGHLEPAAGIAGLIKVVLSLEYGEIPPHLHLQQLNPHLALEGTPFFIPRECQPWNPIRDRRLAGVSGFSFGGTNCHVIIEAAPEESRQVEEQGSSGAGRIAPHILTLSAKNEAALTALAQGYADFLAYHPEVSIADVCFTANTGRSHFAHRLAIVAESHQQLDNRLRSFTLGQEIPGLWNGKVVSHQTPKIAFLFTGQGSQYLGMGHQLYQTQPIFRKSLERCDEILRPELEKPLLSILYPAEGESSLLDETAYIQPALFAIAYALTQLWKSWGIEPHAVIGHSLGEYAAACVAGVFSLEQGLKLVARRARLMQSLPPGGSMVAVFADEATVSKVLTEFNSSLVSIATLNSAHNTVISGQSSEIQKIGELLEQQGIKTHPLKVSHSFHSPLIEPILDQWEEIAQQFQFAKPKIPLVSNLTGNFFSEQEIPDAHYWRGQTRNPVRFKEGIDALLDQGYELFVEIGPKPILSKLGQKSGQGTWLSSIVEGEANWQSLASSLAVIYTQGIKINWQGWDKDYTRHRLSLPTYPFQRQRYWIEESPGNMSEIKPNSTPPQSQNQEQKQKIISELSVLVGNLLHIPVAEVDCRTPLLEMGADSLVLLDAVREIENIYGLKISINQLFEAWPTIEALGTHLAEQLPTKTLLETSSSPKSNGVRASEVANVLNGTKQLNPQTSPSRESLVTVNGQNHPTNIISEPIEPELGVPSSVTETAAERIISQQLQIMSQQLEILQGKSVTHYQQRKQVNGKSSSYGNLPNKIIETNKSPSREKEKKKSLPKLTPTQSPELTSQQQEHLQALIRRYSQRTQKSKQRAEFSRPMLADSRAVAGFRPSIKEMLYPIVGEKAQGSRFWDLDGNEYLDITMGFGVLLLGHNSPVITQAIQAQLQKGLQIGPQANFATETANLIRDLTGVERVTFCNSGTEAVMTALRLARTVTKRKKIALFSGSYHGHFDGVLALAAQGSTKAIPMSLGVTENAVQELLVLEYDNPQSLEILADHAAELAGVLVEPVPSRRPNLQPQAFLQQLRKFTQAADIPLIFDEVLVGFRIHPGGAQAWFDIEADLVTYGKIVGGGLPIGVVAGKAKYLDGIDGGQWNYGDNSYPTAAKTFFAGTFNKNHLGMAAACAMLSYLKQEGASLQQKLNDRTTKLANTLNRYFEAEEIPLQLVYFGSLFRFASNANIDLLYYHLLEKGVYIWEGRNCFLSTAHSDEDLEFLIRAIQESVTELRQGGFLNRQTTKIKGVAQTKDSVVPRQSALSSSDKRSQPEPQANPQNSCKLLTPRAIYQSLAPQITEITQHREVVNYPQAFLQLEKLSFAYIIQAFEQLGWKFRLNEQFSRDIIAEKLNVDSQYRQVFDRLLEILAQESIIAPLESHWQVAKIPQSRDTQEFAQQILAKYPFIKAELNLLNRCGQALSEVLQGKCHPLQLIFPQGDLSSSTELYQESPLASLMNSLVQKSISLALLPLAQNQQELRTRVENKVRILEIGAGTGGTTAGILPHLPQEQVEYYFTDISPLFINRAKQKFSDYPFVKYGTLDIEEEPTSQSLGNFQYDIIVVANVLHSTANLAQTLQHIRQLLRPGGILVILEGTAPQRWLDLIFGLTEGWWKFSDLALRPNYPLISAEQWQTLLQEQGFRETITLPDQSPLSSLQAVIVARRLHQIPLTKAQKQLWALATINQEGSIAYNESLRLELRGPLQVEVMRQAVQQVIDRHEALRIVIDSSGETQEILPGWKIEIPYLDFSQAEPTEVTDWLAKTVEKPFDLSEKPLLRVEIVKLARELHWLVITIHHIISDGWSIDVICQDLGKFYTAQCQGIALQLMPPKQFSDFIQNQHYFQEQRQQEEAYWLEQFSSPISHLELPTDYPRPSMQTYQGKQQSTIIAAPITIALQTLSHQQGATLFMTLLTSFNLLLQHLSGQKDLVIGISVARQLALGWKDLVGYCVNVLPLRLNLDKTTFLDHLKSVKKLLLQAYKYQNYPYAQLLEKLKLKRDPSYPPLISVQFNLDKFGQWLDFEELEVQGITNFSGATRRDLTWNLTEMKGELTLTATYNKNLFKCETIVQWSKKFESLLQIIGQEPEITISEIFQHLQEFDRQQNQRKEQELYNMAAKKLKRIKRKTINQKDSMYVVLQSYNPMISQADLIEISHRSQSLSQRLNHKLTNPGENIAHQATFIDSKTKQQNIAQRLQRWCQVVADGDWEKFHKRLSWDDLEMEQIESLLENAHLTKETQPLPWTNTLITLGETAAEFNLKQIDNQILVLPIEPEDPLPFEEAFLPGIIVARQKLSARLAITALSPDSFPLTILSQAAYRSLERMLLQRLIVLSAKTLYFEFCQFRPSIYEGINLLLEELNLATELEANSPEKKYYHAFLEQLWQDGFWALWQKYPVLARLIAITLDFWVEATAEFIERFQLDCPEIAKRLEIPKQLGQITSIKGSLSDFHNQGRSVLILTFESGQKLVYKPQNLEIAVAYNKFLDWCNQQQCPLPFKVINHYNRGNYGWVLDYVEQEPCPDRASSHRFYQRGGMLLCLLYVLGANDCHYENVIAHGEELVLIDLETMMHPQAQAIADSPQAIQEMLIGTQTLSDSVLRTGLLPRWDFSPDNLVAYDISGLGSIETQTSPRLLPKWKSINTDEMYLVNSYQKLPVQANIPRLNKVALAPQNYLKDIIEGFTQMYCFLREKRQTLLEEKELLALFASQTVRFIFRATHVYQALLEKTLSPEYLRHGIDRSIELDILSRTFLHAEERPQSWSILAAELTAMEQLDIPYFGTTANSNDLTVGVEQPIAQYLNSSYDRFIERLQALSDRDLTWQIKMIRSSFASRFPTSFPFESSISRAIAENEIPSGMPAQPNQFLIEARRIAEEIQATSIIDSTGNAHWMGLGYVDNSERFQLQPLGYNLYDGKSGVALFLTALDWVTGERNFRHLAVNALNPLRKLLRNSNQDLPQKFLPQMGIGGATGIGSIIYSLVKIAQFLEDETWLEDASLVANFLTPEMIEGDRKLDIISGGAGTLLGLLSLYQKTGEVKFLHQSIACGQSLVSKRISFDDKPRAWKTIAKIPLTGFSHGAAGIAYALLRLYEVTQDQQYLAVAREGIAYETAVFSPTAHNWPDFSTMQPTFKVMWCHGAAGIGLARLGGLHLAPKQDFDRDIEIALETTEKYSRPSVDHLCCGHFGRIEFLLKAGHVLNRSQLSEIASQKATNLMQQAQKNRGYRLFGNASQGALNPGFFQGISGIGYQFLRLAYPELLPVILLWE